MMPRSMQLVLSWGMLSIAALQSNLPPQQLPVYGGGNGTAFSRDCGTGKVLTGLRFRAGLSVDAVGLLCRPVNSNGTLGSETTVGTLVGGSTGGTSGSRSCQRGSVVVSASIRFGSFVDGIFLHCRSWDAKTRKVVDAQQHLELFGRALGNTGLTETCEAPTQPASAIRGRAGSLVDAIGFTCDEP